MIKPQRTTGLERTQAPSNLQVLEASQLKQRLQIPVFLRSLSSHHEIFFALQKSLNQHSATPAEADSTNLHCEPPLPRKPRFSWGRKTCLWSDYRNFQLEAAESAIDPSTRQSVWYHFSLTYLYTTFLGSVTNGLTRFRVGRFLILSLMWTWKRFLLMPVSHSNCCRGYKSFIAPHRPTAEYKEWVYYVRESMTNTQACSFWKVPSGTEILLTVLLQVLWEVTKITNRQVLSEVDEYKQFSDSWMQRSRGS